MQGTDTIMQTGALVDEKGKEIHRSKTKFTVLDHDLQIEERSMPDGERR